MPEIPIALAVAGALLVVVAILCAAILARLSALVAARDAAQREAADLRTRIEVLAARSEDFERDLRQDLANARVEQAGHAQAARTELAGALDRQAQALAAQIEAIRATVEQRLELLRSDNAAKLEAMRATVDEKLQATLEQRLGQTFKQVADRLDQVHQGLGEMQALAAGVGDLKRVLSNVKARGGWGEVQLGALLAEMLTAGQYECNVATRPGSRERVEFAVKFPGRGDDGVPCWLPIDAKFPLEDFQRLQDAIERADAAAVEASRRALDAFFRAEARSIRDKYVAPPHTTDFAILFVPTEGLYAEAVGRPGLADALQREFRVMLAGPTNLAALLNSLQLGFRTLAIERRSTEVWRVLGAVKTEFGKFGEILAKTKERLDQVGRTLDDASRKSTTIARRLKDVEELPQGEADRLLTGGAGGPLELAAPAGPDARVDPDADAPRSAGAGVAAAAADADADGGAGTDLGAATGAVAAPARR